MNELHLDLQTNTRLPEVGFYGVEVGVFDERHDARIELLDDVIEIHFRGFLVVAWRDSVGELSLRILAQHFESSDAYLNRYQVASQSVRALTLGIS